MADTVNNIAGRQDELIREIARVIEDHKGQDTLALYIGEISSWTDYFIISTVTSAGHLRGLLRTMQEYLAEKQIDPLRSFKNADVTEEGWVLIDCGSFVIHLMRKETREFYELERLWFAGSPVYGEV